MIVPSYGRTNRPANKKFIGRDPKTERAHQIEMLLKQGMSVTEIAEALGMKRVTLSQVMARYGLKKP